ncbi:aminoglycoside phosphotransferase family protein [Angustibacter speluncae]
MRPGQVGARCVRPRGGVLEHEADAPVVLDRHGLVVRTGATVTKQHPGTEPALLADRLAVAARVPALLTPLGPPDGRASSWPAARAPVPDAEGVPWTELGTLLADLHRADPGPLPPTTGPARVARALRRAVEVGAVPRSDVATVLGASCTAPDWAVGEAPVPAGGLVHGDLHLGQLVEHGGRWCLVDVDDLGTGPAVWDLARPASWFAAGLVDADAWAALVDAYRAADGPALPPTGDPWPVVDPVARALVVQQAAVGLVACAKQQRPPTEPEAAHLAACRAMVR